jgi:hypothetical protein
MATKKNRKKLYIGLGIAGALLGIGIFTWPKIKELIKPEDKGEDIPKIDTNPVQELPEITIKPDQETKEDPGTKKIDIYKKLKSGVLGQEVTALQTIINLISGLRGTYGKTIQIDGKALTFPIPLDTEFGKKTRLGALYTFPAFKSNGYVTLYTARKKYAYACGYYDKPFPSNLVGTAKYTDYKNSYTLGKADGVKKEITDNFWKI